MYNPVIRLILQLYPCLLPPSIYVFSEHCDIIVAAQHHSQSFHQQRTPQGGAMVTQMGLTPNQCFIVLSVITKTDWQTHLNAHHTHIYRQNGYALVDEPLGWSEKASHLRSMSFQPDEQSVSSEDLYSNQ